MEFTCWIAHILSKDNTIYNMSIDNENDIINADYKKKSYRIIVEAIEP